MEFYGDLPAHIPMWINKDGQGPLGFSEEEIAQRDKEVCWHCHKDGTNELWPCAASQSDRNKCTGITFLDDPEPFCLYHGSHPCDTVARITYKNLLD